MDDELLKKLELLNSLWGRLKVMPKMIKLVHEIVMAEFNLENEYESPFDVKYEIQDIVSTVERRLTGFVVKLVIGDLNVRVSADGVYERFKEHFNAVEIARYIELKYLSRADELAFKQILEKARKLLPYSVRNEDQAKMEEIQKKNRLVLQYYLYWSFGRPSYMYDFIEAGNALEKLARIILYETKPSKVQAWMIANAYVNCTSQEEMLEKKKLNGPIVAIKLHKNGKVYFWFENEDGARRVAEVLVYGDQTKHARIRKNVEERDR